MWGLGAKMGPKNQYIKQGPSHFIVCKNFSKFFWRPKSKIGQIVCAKSIFTLILKVFGVFLRIEWPIWVWLTPNFIKINVNSGQNKFEVHISKNVAKMAILWPRIGQRHFGACASHGHNLAIFHQILTNEHTKMTSSLRRIEWNKILSSISLFYILVFWPHFCSEASHGQCCTYGLKTTLKLLVHVLAIMASSYLKIVFLQKSGLNPPPPPPPPPPLK